MASEAAVLPRPTTLSMKEVDALTERLSNRASIEPMVGLKNDLVLAVAALRGMRRAFNIHDRVNL